MGATKVDLSKIRAAGLFELVGAHNGFHASFVLVVPLAQATKGGAYGGRRGNSENLNCSDVFEFFEPGDNGREAGELFKCNHAVHVPAKHRNRAGETWRSKLWPTRKQSDD